MIKGFHGAARWLSNFAPVSIIHDGITYPSVEHFYVAMKTLDPADRQYIATIETPAKAKKYGQKLKKQGHLRADWERVRLSVMKYGLKQKFSQQPYKWMLEETGDEEIIEDNWWHDTFWGVCNGVGENNLGKLIMKIRDGEENIQR